MYAFNFAQLGKPNDRATTSWASARLNARARASPAALAEAGVELAHDLGGAGVAGADRALRPLAPFFSCSRLALPGRPRGGTVASFRNGPESAISGRKGDGPTTRSWVCSGGLRPFRGPVATCSPCGSWRGGVVGLGAIGERRATGGCGVAADMHNPPLEPEFRDRGIWRMPHMRRLATVDLSAPRLAAFCRSRRRARAATPALRSRRRAGATRPDPTRCPRSARRCRRRDRGRR